MNNKISVIMPSYLGDYEGCATNRGIKFERAVESVINQSYQNFELIIVADGCEDTLSYLNNLSRKHDEYFKLNKIRLIKIRKQELFSGNVRQSGLQKATGDIICYLDCDDFFGENHLKSLNNEFSDDVYWVYYNDYFFYSKNDIRPRIVSPEQHLVGTSSIAHRNIKPFFNMGGISWKGCNGYGHDWKLIEKLIRKYSFKKIYGMSYYVCHNPNINLDS